MNSSIVQEDTMQRETDATEDQMERQTTNDSKASCEEDEMDEPRGPAGYAHLAEFMAMTHHGMVRRYKDISLLNLLYLQAEMDDLKKKLDQETAVDATFVEDIERPFWDYHWRALATSGQRGEGKRWQIWLKLKEVLYEYYDAIDKHARLVELEGPTNNQRKILSAYIADDDLNGGRCAFRSAELRGMEPEVYREKYLEDLVMFEGPGRERLVSWFVDPALRLLHRVCPPWKRTVQDDLESAHVQDKDKDHSNNSDDEEDDEDDEEEGENENGGEKKKEKKKKKKKKKKKRSRVPPIRLYQYTSHGYELLAKVIRTALSISLPCAAIISLNAVPDQNKRVAMVCAFSVVFSLAMSICSQSRGSHVFAVTAAFMSVQLVFVGGNGGGGNGGGGN